VCQALIGESVELDCALTSKFEQLKRRYLRLERLLDAGYGACWLKSEEIALIVVDSFAFLTSQGHRVLRWVIMPNHLHLLIELRPGSKLSAVLRSFKGYTGSMINRALGRTGSVWYPEFFDRYIRDEEHYNAVVSYIDNNPVRAGLVKQQREWRFSSVGWTDALEGRHFK
jgi:REP element-mobilizing transposase RayT